MYNVVYFNSREGFFFLIRKTNKKIFRKVLGKVIQRDLKDTFPCTCVPCSRSSVRFSVRNSSLTVTAIPTVFTKLYSCEIALRFNLAEWLHICPASTRGFITALNSGHSSVCNAAKEDHDHNIALLPHL